MADPCVPDARHEGARVLPNKPNSLIDGQNELVVERLEIFQNTS
jgi:hypothetical protein